MGPKFPVVKDAVERIVATFVVTVLGLATAPAIGVESVLKLDNWKAWALAGVVAAFALAKTVVASWIGRVNGRATSASLAPGVKLQPEGSI
jgi:hypothetical protein